MCSLAIDCLAPPALLLINAVSSSLFIGVLFLPALFCLIPAALRYGFLAAGGCAAALIGMVGALLELASSGAVLFLELATSVVVTMPCCLISF